MDKNRLVKPLLTIIAIALVALGFWYLDSHQAKKTAMLSQPTGAAQFKNLSLSYAEDNKSFSILSDGQNIKTITINSIPSFDQGDFGPAVPQTDYLFQNPPGQNDFYDASRQKIYFVVYNHATAGVANADHALFSYGLTDQKISLVLSNSFSDSFGQIRISPDGHYIVFTDGIQLGFCRDVFALAVYDLNSNRQTAEVGPSSSPASVSFKAWTCKNSFSYEVYSYKSPQECQKHPDNPTITTETFTIPN